MAGFVDFWYRSLSCSAVAQIPENRGKRNEKENNDFDGCVLLVYHNAAGLL